MKASIFFTALLAAAALAPAQADTPPPTAPTTPATDATRPLALTLAEVWPDHTAWPLARAAARGDAREIQALVVQGADINAQGLLQTSLLEWAFLHRSVDGMRALLAAGATPPPRPKQGLVLTVAKMREDALKHQNTELRDPELTAMVRATLADRARAFHITLFAVTAVGRDASLFDLRGNLDGDRALYQRLARHTLSQNILHGTIELLAAGAAPQTNPADDREDDALLRLYLDALRQLPGLPDSDVYRSLPFPITDLTGEPGPLTFAAQYFDDKQRIHALRTKYDKE